MLNLMEESVNVNRRRFVFQAAAGTFAACCGVQPLLASDAEHRLTILHTNDVHSRIDPFEANHAQYAGQGGAARRSWLINQVRDQEKNVLVFDSGDIFQGTPYFNMFKGEPEILLMNHMGFNAATIGNHEFDAGLLNLSKRIEQAKFSFLCTNYNFDGSPLAGLTKRWDIFEFGDFRVGVIGLGIELAGLVDPDLYGSTRYLDPISTGEEISLYLKARKKCSLVIALSHLGYSYRDQKISDRVLAENTSEIDIILGGHTHTFLDEPVTVLNKKGREVLIRQCGYGGIKLGRIELILRKKIQANSFFLTIM